MPADHDPGIAEAAAAVEQPSRSDSAPGRRQGQAARARVAVLVSGTSGSRAEVRFAEVGLEAPSYGADGRPRRPERPNKTRSSMGAKGAFGVDLKGCF